VWLRFPSSQDEALVKRNDIPERAPSNFCNTNGDVAKAYVAIDNVRVGNGVLLA